MSVPLYYTGKMSVPTQTDYDALVDKRNEAVDAFFNAYDAFQKIKRNYNPENPPTKNIIEEAWSNIKTQYNNYSRISYYMNQNIRDRAKAEKKNVDDYTKAAPPRDDPVFGQSIGVLFPLLEENYKSIIATAKEGGRKTRRSRRKRRRSGKSRKYNR